MSQMCCTVRPRESRCEVIRIVWNSGGPGIRFNFGEVLTAMMGAALIYTAFGGRFAVAAIGFQMVIEPAIRINK